MDISYTISVYNELEELKQLLSLLELSKTNKDEIVIVHTYRNEEEKTNLLYWQVTCESFYTPSEWEWWFNHTEYKGDYSFIYFE